jgi:spore germination cell wall hydrolase CwlJ-like protein
MMNKRKLQVYSISFVIGIFSLLFYDGGRHYQTVREETIKESTFITSSPVPLTIIGETELVSLHTLEFTMEEEMEPEPTPTPTVTPELTPTPEPEPEPEPVYDFTEEEVDLLARLINSEAGIESYDCKLAVGSTVLNRMESDEFPDTLEDVVYQRKPCVQFSVILSIDGKRPINKEPSKDSIKAAEYLKQNGSILPNQVMVFYADYIDHGWVTTRPKYKKIDHTVFAYLKKGDS